MTKILGSILIHPYLPAVMAVNAMQRHGSNFKASREPPTRSVLQMSGTAWCFPCGTGEFPAAKVIPQAAVATQRHGDSVQLHFQAAFCDASLRCAQQRHLLARGAGIPHSASSSRGISHLPLNNPPAPAAGRCWLYRLNAGA